ncbi:peptidyl-prolyl cis-trans isomerase-like 2 [Orbicella faveolata]|uniref:peptidyl-prolyl cis-trans isomerase-like 2 n=1 Tax=Orbicella faveolata TaxID=48498 RepID=UPI0009E45D46|nr:peptidyl-prolyl cis-trans isomerase-like 2 [Orbicella faveolata]
MQVTLKTIKFSLCYILDVPEKASFRRLPFHCCSLSMQPFEHPLCTKDGIIFDLLNIVPYLKKYGKNPVTGEPLQAKELVKLNFHKNAEDKYHCPVTFKVFNNNSHIVAVKTTGNVFSYDVG